MSELNTHCDICGASDGLALAEVPPKDAEITLCATCQTAVGGRIEDNPHWQCLNDAIWSQTPAVQVTAYRLLQALQSKAWARDLLDIAYLEPETLEWANAASITVSDENAVVHKDTNGAVLSAGDTVTLIKDLNVKGGGFTAKRGTAVRNISLVSDNAGQIEGRVNGQQIVILTEFVKKSG